MRVARTKQGVRIDWNQMVRAHGYECLPVMLREVCRGRTLAQAAEILGTSTSALHKKMVSVGIPRQPVGRR